MKKLLFLSALIVYIFACCPSSATSPPTPVAETATAQPLAVPSEPTDTPAPPPVPTETSLLTDTPLPTEPPAPSQLTAKVTASSLNVRAGPGTDYPTVGQLSLNDSVEVVGRNAASDWLQIVYPADSDSRAWIAAAYAEITASPETVPEVSVPPPPEPTPAPLPPGRVQAQVVSVIDGDTIEVSIEGQTFKLRYIGIDTPMPTSTPEPTPTPTPTAVLTGPCCPTPEPGKGLLWFENRVDELLQADVGPNYYEIPPMVDYVSGCACFQLDPGHYTAILACRWGCEGFSKEIEIVEGETYHMTLYFRGY